ncbi:MAG: tetratricopeptide repeat protein [Fidelibacterota bacterium]
MISPRQKQSLLFIALAVALVLSGCRENPERHLKLGNWYLQRGLLEEAILEYREVTRMMPGDYTTLSREEFDILTSAHYNLALVYTKKGWWDSALKEALLSFELQPTKDNRSLVDLIRQRLELGETSATH